MSLTKDTIVAANRRSWNEAAGRHRAHAQYARLLQGFATPGFSVLDATLTQRLLGLGLPGKAVAQFCCNNARAPVGENLGAASVTGFDFAAAFLDQARELATAGGIETPVRHLRWRRFRKPTTRASTSPWSPSACSAGCRTSPSSSPQRGAC